MGKDKKNQLNELRSKNHKDRIRFRKRVQEDQEAVRQLKEYKNKDNNS